MNKPSTFLVSILLLILLMATTIITLIAYSPTFNRPFRQVLRMMELTGPLLPDTRADISIGAPLAADSPDQDPSAARLLQPRAVAVGIAVPPNMLWVADTGNNRVLGFAQPSARRTDLSASHIIERVETPPESPHPGPVEFAGPSALAVDATGGLYIADTGNNRVLYFSQPRGDAPQADWSFGDGDPATALIAPEGLALDAQGNLYIADTGNHRIIRLPGGASGDGAPDRTWGQGGLSSSDAPSSSEEAAAGFLAFPTGIAVRADGLLAVADTGNNRVLFFDTTSENEAPVAVLGQDGEEKSAGSLLAPRAVAFSTDGFYVSDSGNHRVLFFASPESATATGVWGQAGRADPTDNGPSNANFRNPTGLAADPSGNLIVADTDHDRVLIFMH